MDQEKEEGKMVQDERVSVEPVFLAMFAGFMVAVATQFVINLFGGLEIGPFETIGILQWVLLMLLIPLIFAVYLVPATFLIRFIIARSLGIRAPFFRTAGTFLASYVLPGIVFVLFALVLFGDDISGIVLYMIITTYVVFSSYIGAIWFITENREAIIEKKRKDAKT